MTFVAYKVCCNMTFVANYNVYSLIGFVVVSNFVFVSV